MSEQRGNVDPVIAELVEAVRRADRAGARAMLDGWAAEHGHERLVADVLHPMLRVIGDEWCADGSFTVAQVYVAGKIASDALLRIAEQVPPRETSVGVAVVGNIEDDFHSLGRRLVTTFLTADGWDVRDLGNDVPPATFVDEALAAGARVVGVSAMMESTARNITRVRAEIDARGLAGKLQLAVGGAVFVVRPELVREVGGDGSSPSAIGASALFKELQDRADAVSGAR